MSKFRPPRRHHQYPHRPGWKRGSPRTSADAGISFETEAWTRREQAFGFIEHRGAYGATCDEVAIGCGWEERYSSRPRLSELRAMHRITPSGRYRRGVSGRLQTVWIIASRRYADPVQLVLFPIFVPCIAR